MASSFDDGWRRRGGVVRDGFGLWKYLVEPLHLAPHIVDDASDVGLVVDHARRDEQHQLGPVAGQVLIAEEPAENRDAGDQWEPLRAVFLVFADEPSHDHRLAG